MLTDHGIASVNAESSRISETAPVAEHAGQPVVKVAGVDNNRSFGNGSSTSTILGSLTPHTRSSSETPLESEELDSINRRKDEFLAVLSHELRSPLGSIQNAFRLMRSQSAETPAWHKAQALIERQIGRMTQLVDDLFDVSRIAHGHLHVERERIDLCVVIKNTIETLEADIRQRKHRLTVVLPDEPVWLQGDAGRLEQVFVNVLANASRYTAVGGVLVVCLHAQDGKAVVRVRDSGIGIEPHVLPHIFDLFKRADAAALRSKAGLGIGLTLVRDLVELHGGSVTAASAGAGQGSEFTICLPRAV
jgi:signal transduction histidine kinase